MRFHAKKICLCILGVSMLAGAARAQDIVGRLHLQIILEPGCAVSNGAQSEIGNAHLDFGAADNASHPVDSVVVGDDGRAAFSITCSSHYTGRNALTVSIDSGLHMRGMQRRMAGPGSSYAVYGLFRHRARKEATIRMFPCSCKSSLRGSRCQLTSSAGFRGPMDFPTPLYRHRHRHPDLLKEIRMTRLRFATLAAMVALLPLQASAASLRISPIGVEMPSTERAAAITIANTDAEPVSLQIRIYRWSQVNGEEKLEPATDMFVSPPAVVVPAGASYTIRVARSAATPVDGELSYRLVIDELPKPIDPRTVGQGVKMVLRTSMPVFVAGKKAVANLAWTAWQDGEGTHAQAVNTGQRHAKIAGLTLQPAGGPLIGFGAGLNGYVLAGATKEFHLKTEPGARPPPLAAGTTVTLAAKNDALDIGATVTMGMR